MTQNLKNLSLDAAKIEGAVHSFPRLKSATLKKTAKFDEYCIQMEKQEDAEQQDALLHVYSRTDGKFTLMATVGKNQALSFELAKHVAETCKLVVREQRPLTLARLDEADWQFLMDHLRDYGYEISERPLEHGQRFDVKKDQHDYVNLNRYTRAGNFLMQGKAREVYGAVVDILTEQLPDKRELVEAQLKTYDVKEVKVDALFDELRQHAPSAVNLLGDTGAAILAPALALSKLDIQLPDYSCIAYHALRGLEAYMKAIMSKNSHAVENHVGFGKCMELGGTRLSAGIRGSMTNEEAIAVENGYALLKADRNPLFHADANPEMSRILPDKADATSIMYSVLHLLETTAAAIPAHARSKTL